MKQIICPRTVILYKFIG